MRAVTLVCALAASLVVLAAQAPAVAQGSAYSSCNDPLVLVDRYNGLSAGYVPSDLTYLSSYGIPTTGGGQLLRYDAALALSNMVEDANAAGVELVSSSAYRSYYTQASLYNYWTGVYGLYQSFVSTDSCNWLLYNARYYGFVLTYPPGANTGYIWEPWQWRYVGVQNDLNVVGSGLSLQGYLSNYDILPNC